MAGLRVLIVDGEHDIAEAWQNALRARGHSSRLSDTFPRTHQMLQQNIHFDLAVISRDLPGGDDGRRLIPLLETHQPRPSVVLLWPELAGIGCVDVRGRPLVAIPRGLARRAEEHEKRMRLVENIASATARHAAVQTLVQRYSLGEDQHRLFRFSVDGATPSEFARQFHLTAEEILDQWNSILQKTEHATRVELLAELVRELLAPAPRKAPPANPPPAPGTGAGAGARAETTDLKRPQAALEAPDYELIPFGKSRNVKKPPRAKRDRSPEQEETGEMRAPVTTNRSTDASAAAERRLARFLGAGSTSATDLGVLRRVLIVDDEPHMQRMLRIAFSNQGWFVQTCSDGKGALRAIAGEDFDIALIDKNIPGIDGMELIRRVRELGHELPIILITGDPSPEIASKLVPLRISGYMLKPMERLGDVVKRADALVSGKNAEG